MSDAQPEYEFIPGIDPSTGKQVGHHVLPRGRFDNVMDRLDPDQRNKLAKELSGQLAASLKPEPEHLPVKLGMWEIQSELAALLDLREQAVEDGELPATLATIDKEIAEYQSREVRKVNGTCAAIRAYQSAAEDATKEADRLYERARRFRARADLIKANSLAAMLAHGVTKLETPANTIRIQGNGGLQALDIPTWPKDSSGNFKPLPEGAHNQPDDIPIVTLIVPDTVAIREKLKNHPQPWGELLPRGKHLRLE